MNTNVKKAGDVLVKYITIQNASGIGYNITPQVFTIELYEEMNVPVITGKVFIKDGQNLTNVFPLIGNEVIDISFITPGLEDDQGYTKTFFVYGCSEKIKQDRISYYELKIVSVEAAKDKIIKISKKFTGNAADIVKQILCGQNFLNVSKQDVGVIENSVNSIEFISNWWSPFKCIKYVTDRSVNTNNSPSFVFFQNKHGYSFLSLDSLFADSVIKQTFYKNNDATQANEGVNSTSNIDVLRDYQTILDMRINSGFDYFDRIQNGFYGGEVVGFDCATAQYTHTAVERFFDEDSHLNKHSPITDVRVGGSSGNITLVPYHSCTFDDYYANDLKVRTSRSIFMSRLNGTKMTIRVHGRSDYNIGQVVTIMIPKDQQITKDENPYDMLISGNYLIVAVNHSVSVTGKRHECIIELVKDSYAVDINNSTLNENN